MPKTATYTGKADQYYVTDRTGRRHYLRRGELTEIPDDMAAQLKGRKNITVGDAAKLAGKETEK